MERKGKRKRKRKESTESQIIKIINGVAQTVKIALAHIVVVKVVVVS